jgi:hypothetical protein
MGTAMPGAIAIDTLNRSISGSESSDEDMGAYVKGLDAIREAFACCVIVVHHCGHDDRRPRGHTSLTGAADAQLAVRNTDGMIEITVEHMKDGESGATIGSTLRQVEIGTDAEGDPITSCVVEPHTSAGRSSPRRKVSGNQGLALEALCDVLAREGRVPPPSDHIPANVPVVPLKRWRDHFLARAPGTDIPDTNRKRFDRAATTLVQAGVISKWQSDVWIIREPDAGQDTAPT